MREGVDEPEEAEEGSVLLLVLGYAILALSLIFVCVCATDLYIAQKRLDALADAAALAGSDGFTIVVDGDSVRAELSDDGVEDQAAELLDAMPGSATLVSASSPDGLSARVRIATEWRPPLLALFVSDGVRLEATGTSRTAVQ